MLKVIYILGFARSGTTLLGNLLGEVPGFFHVGEVHSLWVRAAPQENRRPGWNQCGCGELVPDCPLWSPIIHEVAEEIRQRRLLPQASPDDGELCGQLWDLQVRAVPRERYRQGDAEARRQYAAVLEVLYRITAARTGAGVLVDSSKKPPVAALIESVPTVEPYYVHIVRDPRGAVVSRQKRKARRVGERLRLSPVTTVADSVRWMYVNYRAEKTRASLPPERQFFCTYEEFIADPRAALAAILDMVGVEEPSLPFLGAGSAVLGPNHTICGNKNRFATGEIPLRLDTFWQGALSRPDRWLISTLTAVGRRRYGYSR